LDFGKRLDIGIGLSSDIEIILGIEEGKFFIYIPMECCMEVIFFQKNFSRSL